MERLSRSFRAERRLRPGDLLRLMQELASDDADRRGGGRNDLLRQNCVWVLIKNRLEISRWPEAGESLSLTTWPMQGRRSFYPRFFELRDENGALLIAVSSLWAIMDVESREMITGESRGISLAGCEEGRFTLPPRLRIPEGGTLHPLIPRTEQIDANHHMNNAAYLDAAEELLPAFYDGRELSGIAVEYEHELLPGHEAQVRVVPETDACFFEGVMGDKLCFRLKLSFQ